MPLSKNNPYSKNLKHYLSCDRCGFKDLPCPRGVEEVTKSNKQSQTTNEFKVEDSQVHPDLLKQVMKLNISEKCLVLREIVRSEIKSIKSDKDSSQISPNASIESIAKTDHKKWYEDRCVLLKAFGDELAKGADSRSVVQENRENSIRLLQRKINLLQSVFKLIDTKYVSSIGASSNLLHFTTSNSPLAGIVLSATGSGGGHSIAQKLINNLPPEPLDVHGDQIEVVDNNGQDGNTYNAKKNSMKKVSLVTARMVFRINPEGRLQKSSKLKPENYLFITKENKNPEPNISSSIINNQMKPSTTSQTIYKKETLRKLKISFDKAKSGFSPGALEDGISETVKASLEKVTLGKRRKKPQSESDLKRSKQSEEFESTRENVEGSGSTEDQQVIGLSRDHGEAAGSSADQAPVLGLNADQAQVSGNVVGSSADQAQVSGNVVGSSAHQAQVSGNVVGSSAHQAQVSGYVLGSSAHQAQVSGTVVGSSALLSKASGSSAHHGKVLGSSAHHGKALGSSAHHGKALGSSAHHGKALGSSAHHGKALGSSAHQEQVTGLNGDQAQAWGSTTDQAQVFEFSADHVLALGSSAHKAQMWGSCADQAHTSGSSADLAQASRSSADQAQASGSSADQVQALGSSEDQVQALGSSADQAQALGSSADQAQALGSSADQAQASGSTTDQTKAPSRDNAEPSSSTRDHVKNASLKNGRSGEPSKKPTREQVHGRVPHNHLPKQSAIIMDPILENPNSFLSIQVVFREILSKNTCREWIVLYSDGVPYWLGYKVILWSFVCNECDAKVFKEVGWTKHCKDCHPDMENVTRRLEFGRILLMPGAGHIGMQMVKGLRRATFKVWGDVNAEVLGCRSPKAMLWYQNANDTHQGLEHTMIEEAAIGEEIMSTYIRDQICQGRDLEDLSVEDFLTSWIEAKRQSCPNIKYAFDMVTKYYVAVDIFNLGVRRNNPDYIQCGLDYFRDFWHVMNTPIYRPLAELFETTKTLLPSELKEFVIASQSLRTSEDLTSGQGVDFRMEECNQNIQAQLPPGAPTEQVWIRTYRNYDSLMENRTNWFHQQGLKDPRLQENLRVRCPENLEEEIKAFRVEIRKRDYFNVNNHIHTGLRGNALHPQLASFKEVAPNARVENLKKVVTRRSFLELSKTEIELFVEESDERKRTQKSLSKINDMIRSKIDSLIDSEERDTWHDLWMPYKQLNTKQAAWYFFDMLENNDKTM